MIRSTIGLILLFLMFGASCTPTEQYAGTYTGTLKDNYYNINPGQNYSSTTPITFGIKAAIGSVILFNNEVPMKDDGTGSLESDYGVWFKVQFVEDSVFVYYHSNKGHGGGAGHNYYYRAKKVD